MRRDNRYHLRLSDDENQVIKAQYANYVNQGGTLPITNWIREKALSTKGDVTIITVQDSGDLKKAVFELNKIGVNINQIMKKINENDSIQSNYDQFQDTLSTINSLMISLTTHVDSRK